MAVALLAATTTSSTSAFGQSSGFYDRNSIPGHYTLGLYADAQGKSRKLDLGSAQQELEAFIGVTGDSLHTFSACTFTLELPQGLSLDGAIRWRTIPGLQQWGSATEDGVRVEYADSCQVQTGEHPVILGRVRMKADPTFREGEVKVGPHLKYGCSVELCAPGWPKPYATGLGLVVHRKVSILQRVRDLF